MNGQNGKPRCEPRDRNELLVQAGRWIGVEQVVQRVHAGAIEQRIAVRRRPRSQLRADRTIRPWPIVDDHRLTQRFPEFLRDLTGAHVRRRPRTSRNEADRLVREVLRRRGCRQCACSQPPPVLHVAIVRKPSIDPPVIANVLQPRECPACSMRAPDMTVRRRPMLQVFLQSGVASSALPPGDPIEGKDVPRESLPRDKSSIRETSSTTIQEHTLDHESGSTGFHCRGALPFEEELETFRMFRFEAEPKRWMSVTLPVSAAHRFRPARLSRSRVMTRASCPQAGAARRKSQHGGQPAPVEALHP